MTSRDDTPLQARADQINRWISEAREGSSESLGKLLQANHQYLLKLARQNVSISLRAKFDPADLVQATALEAHRNIRDFRGDSRRQLLGWLRRILLNQAADAARFYQHAKKRDISREKSLEPDFELKIALRTEPATPEAVLLNHELSHRFNAVLQALPERMRDAFIMREQDRMTFREIGSRLGCSSEAARKLCYRARSRLRQAM